MWPEKQPEMPKIGSLCMDPSQMALWAGFGANVGVIFQAKIILLNCHPGLQRDGGEPRPAHHVHEPAEQPHAKHGRRTLRVPGTEINPLLLCTKYHEMASQLLLTWLCYRGQVLYWVKASVHVLF